MTGFVQDSLLKIATDPVSFLTVSSRSSFDAKEISIERIYKQFVTFARQFKRIVRLDSEEGLLRFKSMVRDSAELGPWQPLTR